MLESEIQREIMAVLRASRKVDVWRQNCIRRGHIQSVPAGAADISGVICGSGQRVEIEVKQPGKVQSEEQQIWEDRMTASGCQYIVMTSAEEAEKWLAGL